MTREAGRAFRIFKACWTVAWTLGLFVGLGAWLTIVLVFEVFHYGQSNQPAASPAASSTPSAAAAPTPAPTSWQPALMPHIAGPAGAVASFCTAVSNGELYYAWADLGGRNLVPSWSTFQAGYADTEVMDFTVTSTKGDRVEVRIMAQHDDGLWHTYDAVYTVTGGVITAGSLSPVS